MKTKKLDREDFLAMNETEREQWLAKPKKKFEFSFTNRWIAYSSYRIDFCPSFFMVKQLKTKSFGLEWFGFYGSIQINKLEKGELDLGGVRNP